MYFAWPYRGYGVQKLVPSKKKLTRNVLVDYFCKVFIGYVKTIGQLLRASAHLNLRYA